MYPTVDEASGELQTAESIRVAPSVQKLYDYIRERGTLVPITTYNRWASDDGCHSDQMAAPYRPQTAIANDPTAGIVEAPSLDSWLLRIVLPNRRERRAVRWLSYLCRSCRELLMHTDVSKAVTESIRSGTPLWESLVRILLSPDRCHIHVALHELWCSLAARLISSVVHTPPPIALRQAACVPVSTGSPGHREVLVRWQSLTLHRCRSTWLRRSRPRAWCAVSLPITRDSLLHLMQWVSVPCLASLFT